MTPSPLALSLTGSFTQIGAVAAFVALVGIAMLSLLAFSQAREIKRLREWAGRAPERAADLKQRVSAEASMRAQQPGVAVQPARPVPRAVPLNARAPAPPNPSTGANQAVAPAAAPAPSPGGGAAPRPAGSRPGTRPAPAAAP